MITSVAIAPTLSVFYSEGASLDTYILPLPLPAFQANGGFEPFDRFVIPLEVSTFGYSHIANKGDLILAGGRIPCYVAYAMYGRACRSCVPVYRRAIRVVFGARRIYFATVSYISPWDNLAGNWWPRASIL